MTALPLIPETAPFNAGQRLWLNGYMAGLSAGRGYVPAGQTVGEPAVTALTVPLLILFGSQTGTAEKLARQIAREAKTRGCNARVVDAAAFASIDWSKETNLLVLTSTYGDGDVPDNAQAFWDWLKSDAPGPLTHLKFSVLALGDTNYEQFCAAGKKIDARLEQLGAQRLHPRTDCEVDYEAAAKTWIAAVLGKVGQASRLPGECASASRETINRAGETPALLYGKKNPFPARLLKNVLLNKDGSDKEVRHYEISLDGSGLTYEAGDALGVMPGNYHELVDNLLATLRCSGDEPLRNLPPCLPPNAAMI